MKIKHIGIVTYGESDGFVVDNFIGYEVIDKSHVQIWGPDQSLLKEYAPGQWHHIFLPDEYPK